MKNIFVLALLSSLSSIITTPAFAEENTTSSAPASTAPSASGKTTFIGVDIGALSGYPNSTGTIVSGLTANGWTSASATERVSPVAYDFHGGQWLSERLGWEVGYGVYGSVDGLFSASTTTQNYFGSYAYSASIVYGAVLGAIPLGSGKLYGKAGLHSTSTTTAFSSYKNNLAVSLITGSTSQSSTGFLLGGGYEYAFNKNWAVRADITMFNGAQFASAWNFATIENKTLIQTAAGLNYSF